ncbi:SEC-C metal-binding domain-containing protein [Elusimicrobiota bacterium]
MRDPNARLPRKIGGATTPEAAASQAPDAKQPPIPVELIDTLNADGAPDLKELESKGLLPKFLRLWNNPATLRRLKTLSQLMKAGGVEPKDKAAVKSWAKKNQDKLEAEEPGQEPAAPIKPFKKTDASVGRNDPCPCGSKKKFKKCCAGK